MTDWSRAAVLEYVTRVPPYVSGMTYGGRKPLALWLSPGGPRTAIRTATDPDSTAR